MIDAPSRSRLLSTGSFVRESVSTRSVAQRLRDCPRSHLNMLGALEDQNKSFIRVFVLMSPFVALLFAPVSSDRSQIKLESGNPF